MRDLVAYTDVFVLLSARNRHQVEAIATAVRHVAKSDFDLECRGTEGLPAARWVLVDFGAVIVHIFDEPLRGFYNLDGLWSDAPRLEPPDDGPAAAEHVPTP